MILLFFLKVESFYQNFCNVWIKKIEYISINIDSTKNTYKLNTQKYSKNGQSRTTHKIGNCSWEIEIIEIKTIETFLQDIKF